MAMQEFSHYSVLLGESIEALDIKPDGIYVDGTAGGGGQYLVANSSHSPLSNTLIGTLIHLLRLCNIS